MNATRLLLLGIAVAGLSACEGGGDSFTTSLFCKKIDNPIEPVAAAGTDDNVALTFINADSADLYGVEFEWLLGLGTVAPPMSWSDAFFVSGNVTLSDSELTIGDSALNLTSDQRRLTQHAPWVVNLQLGFDAPKSDTAHDLIYGYYPTETFSLKVRLQKLLDETLIIEQGGVDVLEQSVGTNLKVDLAYRF
jgi:outer membrane receptor protein involved in Fe transport